MAGFATPEDIANRALQHCRMKRITSFSDHSPNAQETAFVYDKVRLRELRRNLWRFATKRCVLRPLDINAAVFVPAAYSAATTYALGAVVQDANSEWWQSKQAANTANTPAAGAWWRRYYGNDQAEPFDTTLGTAYYPGELVIVPSNWSSGTTYAANALVNYQNTFYVALLGSNLNQNPATATTYWETYTAFMAAGPATPVLYDASAAVYLSLLTNNKTAPWASTASWLLLAGSVLLLQILYPIGTGPATDLSTKNVFRLPHGYLRHAPSDPRGGQFSWLGANSGAQPDDRVFESGYYVSQESGAQMLRYVADVSDVTEMDAMFCEALGAAVANEVAATLVDAELLPVILSEVMSHYKGEVSQARAANAVENGPISMTENRLVTVRA